MVDRSREFTSINTEDVYVGLLSVFMHYRIIVDMHKIVLKRVFVLVYGL